MERFAVDLDAVLDEFELNEDQAEVAAARLQKQIEQGRLEIASSDATPAGSYTESPRHVLGQTVDHSQARVPDTRPSLRNESATRAVSQPSLTHHVSKPSDIICKAASQPEVVNRISANTETSTEADSGKHVTSIEIGGSVAAGSSDPFLSGRVVSGLPSQDNLLHRDPPAPPSDTGVVCPDLPNLPSNETALEPPAATGHVSLPSEATVDQTPIVAADMEEAAAETQYLQSSTENITNSGLCLNTPVPVVNGITTNSSSYPDALASVEVKEPQSNGEAVVSQVSSEIGSVSAPSSVEDTAGVAVVVKADTAGVTPASMAGEPRTSSADPIAAGAETAVSPAVRTLVVETTEVVQDAAVAPGTVPAVAGMCSQNLTTEPCLVRSDLVPNRGVVNEENAENREDQPSKPASLVSETTEDPAAVQSPHYELSMEPSVTSEQKPTESAQDLSSPASHVVAEAVSSQAADTRVPSTMSEQTSPTEADFSTPPQEVEATVGSTPTVAEGTASTVEPVSFQPADDLSDSELDSYLEQLEGETAAAEVTEQGRSEDANGASEPSQGVVHNIDTASEASCQGEDVINDVKAEEMVKDQGNVVDAAFGGARPKTSPAVTTAEAPPPTPAPSAVDTAKGSVISRLQSQVSIECVVDSTGSNGAGHSVGAADPEAAPSSVQAVRPSSLNLSQPTVDAQGQPGDSAATEENNSDADGGAESVSTTGGNIVTAPGAYEEARLAAVRPPSAPSRGQLVSLSDEDKNLGKVAPVWVPDEDAPVCMECEQKFTVIRRRHHCRACGRVLCSGCCSQRMSLDYMEFREGRVCTRCKATMDRVQQETRVVAAGSVSPTQQLQQRERPPNPNNPMEYCSTVPPTQQATPNAPPPTVMVPTGVLKRAEGSGSRTPSREAKQVMFSDGIRPGGDLTEPPTSPGSGGGAPSLVRPPHRRTARIGRADRTPAAVLKEARGCKDLAWKPESGKLPPVYQAGSSTVNVKHSTPDQTIVAMIRAERHLPWSFLINKNLMVLVKIFKLDCCVGRTCWMFSSDGLSTVGQEEVLVVLEALPDETTMPRDVFLFYHHLFAEAAKGNFVTELGHTLFSVPFLGSKDHGGFLFLRPTFQCLHNIPTPPQPFLVAVLIQKWEAPWAKVFPLRLLLRLGAEFRYYPCPLVSVRHRKPVFFEVGHTIINLLADFRNYAYVLPTVHGMHIHMEEQQTSVLVPRNRFNQVLKAINNSNDHVLALGASFSREADSHLVCMQNEDGQYQTQAINIQNRPRQVTGASFIVFNGALKSASGVTAKSSIVEDGLMFQISPDTMQALRAALRQMQDFAIQCGAVGQPPEETVTVRWVEDDRSHNLGVRSVIDDRPLDGIRSIRIHSGTDYVAEAKLIRWTELYLIKVSEGGGRVDAEPPFSRLAEQVARGTCVALAPHLPLLAESERSRLGLRVTIDSETVGYEAGSGGETLPPACMQLLDSELVPVLHRHAAEVPDSPVCLELLFHVIDR